MERSSSMEFYSILFLYTFLPLSVLAFWLVPQKARTGTLLACNLLFGLFSGLWRGPALLLCPLLDYGAARWIEKSPSAKKRKGTAAFLSFFYFLLLAGSFISQWSGREQGLWRFLPLYFSAGCCAPQPIFGMWREKRFRRNPIFFDTLPIKPCFSSPLAAQSFFTRSAPGGSFLPNAPGTGCPRDCAGLSGDWERPCCWGAALWNFGDYAWKTEPPAPYGSAWQAVDWESIFSFPAFPTFPLGWAVCSGCISQKILTILSLPSALENF